ncbi:MAG: radical SAM protein [Candidatus Aenigmatarchaeota archaeon]
MFDFEKEKKINKERIKRLASWYRDKKEAPLQIDAELHKRCNLRCIFCARYDEHEKLNEESKKYEMSVEKWLEIVEEAAELGTVVFNIEGINEPPAIPELFFPVIKKIKEVDLYGIVTTNGTLWKNNQLKDLIEINWDRIHFSLHSSKPEIHDKLTGMKGSFKKAVRIIQNLNKWKKKLKSERPMLNINICVNKLNFRELPKIVKLAKTLKADYIFTEPIMAYTEMGEKLKLSKKELEELSTIIKNAEKIANEFEIDNNFATQDKNLEKEIVKKTSNMKGLLVKNAKDLPDGLISAPCFKPWERIAIRFNGLTGHCGFVEEGENVKEKSLKEIWFGEYFKKARERMLKKELFSHCHKCVPSDFTQGKRFRKELMEFLGIEHERDN